MPRKTDISGDVGLLPGEKPTLKTISRISGMAVPTVSRALNDAPDIGAKTKEAIRQIADQIGYVPNRAGVRLRTGRTNVISLVLSTAHDLTNHTGALISSIAGAMQGTNFHMNVTPYFPTDDIMKPIRYIVETRSADAVIMNQIEPEDVRVRYLLDRGFPFVTHGRSVWSDEHSYYDYDNTVVGQMGVRQLAERGRRNILLIAPPLNQHYAQHIIEGATTEAVKHGQTIHVDPLATSDMQRVLLTQLLSERLAEHPEFDGVICASTSAAMAMVAAMEQNGKVLNRDMDIFAKEAVPILEWFRPGLLKVSEDVMLAGDFVARAAMQAVLEPEAPPMQFLEIPKS